MLRTPHARRLSSAPLCEMMLLRTCSPRSFAPQIKTFIFCSRISRAESQLTVIESANSGPGREERVQSVGLAIPRKLFLRTVRNIPISMRDSASICDSEQAGINAYEVDSTHQGYRCCCFP